MADDVEPRRFPETRIDRGHLRQLSERYARASWSGDTDGAAILLDEIEKIERGQAATS